MQIIPDINEIEALSNRNKLKKLLRFPYSQPIRAAALKGLDKTGWKPKNCEEKASHYIAKGNILQCVCAGNDALWPLIDILKDTDPEIRAQAAEAIGKIRDDRCIEYIRPYLFDNNDNVRTHIAKTLVQHYWKPSDAKESVVFYHSIGNDEKATEILNQKKLGGLEPFIRELDSQPDPEPEDAWEDNQKNLRIAKWGIFLGLLIAIVGLAATSLSMTFGGENIYIVFGPIIGGCIAFFSSLGYWLKNKD